MITQAKRMCSTWESRGRTTTTENKNKTWKRNDQNGNNNNKREINMHEIVKQTISEMFNADKKKADEELNNLDLEEFKNATLSESEGSNGKESA
jgi:hypothetical protein